MTTLRPFTCNDLFKFNTVNLDPLTETYGLSFYMQYLAHWPELFQVAESPNGEIMGYVMGKVEGHGENWHSHVTALTVGPEFRRLGLAATLMAFLEDVSENTATSGDKELREIGDMVGEVLDVSSFTREGTVIKKRVYFVDLFVRVSNRVAISMYKRLGYIVYRTVLEYYSRDPDEDAYDMRKACSRDVDKLSVIPLSHPVHSEDVD